MSLANRTKNKLQSKFKFFLVLLYTIFGVGVFFLPKNFNPSITQQSFSLLDLDQPKKKVAISSFPIQVPTVKYGLVTDTFEVIEKTIQRGEFLADILLDYQLTYPAIDSLVRKSEGIFDTRKIRVGKPYTILTKDTISKPDFFIYEPSVYEYVVFDLRDSMNVYKTERPVTKSVEIAEGEIETSLWNTMVDNGLDFNLAVKMEMALQWSVDFHHLQKGDRFKLVYEQNFIDEEPVGIGQLQAAYFKKSEQEYFAFYFTGEEEEGYYNLAGKPMKKVFLRAPVQYTRISSRYNLRRFHPVLRRRRAHLGTDYAAPYGTPIFAVGNGTVIAAHYTKGNGRFVKIHHNKTYQTQYLHMQKFASGIRPGVEVKQGQVIGYVGSSGLATGPHVCFRFWKNGRQVNHLNLSFPDTKPLPESEIPAFEKVRDHYLDLMAFERDSIKNLIVVADSIAVNNEILDTAP